MKKYVPAILAAGFVLLRTLSAFSQQGSQTVFPAVVVTTCGTQAWTAGTNHSVTVDTTGLPCAQPISVTATVSTTGLASSANQTNSSQKTQIVDGSGNAVTVTGNKLDVNASLTPPAVTAVAGVTSSGLNITTGPVLIGGSNGGVLRAAKINSDGALVVDDSLSSRTITGTVTANAGTNLNTSALALESGGNLATLAGAVSGTKMQDNLAQVAGGTVQGGSGVLAVTIINTGAGSTIGAVSVSGTPTVNLNQVAGGAVQGGSGVLATSLVNTTGTTGIVGGVNVAQFGGTAVVNCGTAGCLMVGMTTVQTAFTSTLGATIFTVVAASSTVLTDIDCFNGDAAANAFIQFFDMGSTITLGTTLPKNSYGVPFGGGFQKNGISHAYVNAIKVAATTTATGSTTATTGLVCNFGFRR